MSLSRILALGLLIVSLGALALIIVDPGRHSTATLPSSLAKTSLALAGGPTLRYAVIGDSYSDGQSVGRNDAWPALVTHALQADGIPIHLVANLATTGWTSGDAINTEITPWEAAQPTVATILIGANDWIQNVPPAVFAQRFAGLLNTMLGQLKDPRRLVVLTIPDFGLTPTGKTYGFGRSIAQGIAAFNAIIAAQAQLRHLTVINLTALSSNMGNRRFVASDGLHPSAIELQRWSAAIAPILARQWSPLVGAPLSAG
jgi:acyl-CoA thioesterase-1